MKIVIIQLLIKIEKELKKLYPSYHYNHVQVWYTFHKLVKLIENDNNFNLEDEKNKRF